MIWHLEHFYVICTLIYASCTGLISICIVIALHLYYIASVDLCIYLGLIYQLTAAVTTDWGTTVYIKDESTHYHAMTLFTDIARHVFAIMPSIFFFVILSCASNDHDTLLCFPSLLLQRLSFLRHPRGRARDRHNIREDGALWNTKEGTLPV